MNWKITGIGDALWDLLPDGRKIGGAPANFAYYMKQFGFDATVVTAVGDDELGEEIKQTFARMDLKHQTEVVGYPTGIVRIELDDRGIPAYEIVKNVAYDHIPYTSGLDEIARTCNVVCFGTLAQRNEVSRNTITRFLDAMPATGETYKVFDINLRQNFYSKEMIAESLKRSNVFKVNDEELAVVKQMFAYAGETMEETCRMILSDWDLKYLILTCGTNGSYIFAEGEESFMDTPKVEVADTVGAGDSFIASFMASILKGTSIKDAHELAVKLSAFVCTQYGGMCDISGFSR
jgi:fructokinase